jgi:glycerophosphoryl diester phosphodiesterase
MVFAVDGQVSLVGHRGLGAGVVDGRRENTLESFMGAVDAGVDWLEVDVRRTADDVLVVAHDPAYDDGAFFTDTSADVAAARGTLMLDHLLSALPVHVGVDFDLKTSMEDATRAPQATTAALLAPVASREALRRPVAVTSFDPAALLATRSLAPAVAVGLLTWLEFPVGLAVAAAAHLDVAFLAVHMGSLQPNRIEPAAQQRPLDYVVSLLHRANRQVLAWCPAPDELPAVLDAGVDAVCVNDVGAAIGLVRRSVANED